MKPLGQRPPSRAQALGGFCLLKPTYLLHRPQLRAHEDRQPEAEIGLGLQLLGLLVAAQLGAAFGEGAFQLVGVLLLEVLELKDELIGRLDGGLTQQQQVHVAALRLVLGAQVVELTGVQVAQQDHLDARLVEVDEVAVGDLAQGLGHQFQQRLGAIVLGHFQDELLHVQRGGQVELLVELLQQEVEVELFHHQVGHAQAGALPVFPQKNIWVFR